MCEKMASLELRKALEKKEKYPEFIQLNIQQYSAEIFTTLQHSAKRPNFLFIPIFDPFLKS